MFNGNFDTEIRPDDEELLRLKQFPFLVPLPEEISDILRKGPETVSEVLPGEKGQTEDDGTPAENAGGRGGIIYGILAVLVWFIGMLSCLNPF